MARITVTTDDGEVMEMWSSDEWGDLAKPLPRSAMANDILEAIEHAERTERRND